MRALADCGSPVADQQERQHTLFISLSAAVPLAFRKFNWPILSAVATTVGLHKEKQRP